ncbi:uncharacterized protein LOC144159261 [Haemaphysalis longicornis]
MSERGSSLHRVRGLVNGANWRETKFAQAVPPHLSCGLCGMISRPTFLLPCLHTLCESCVSHSVHGGNNVCPFDEEPFAVGDCQRFLLPPATADKLKACCWNEAQGCTFVGTLQEVLTHYEQECTFHAATCPRCNCAVLHQDLPRHYRAGCHGVEIAAAAGERILNQGVVVSVQDIGSYVDRLEALVRDPYQDRLLALQSKVNEVLEEARNINTRVEAIIRYRSEDNLRLAEVTRDLWNTLSQELRLQEHSRTVQISEWVNSNGMRIDAIASTLSDSENRLSRLFEEVTRQLSGSFSQTLWSQHRELSALLNKISKMDSGHHRKAEATSAGEMPWKMEKRHILRKLELMATDAHAYLELLRRNSGYRMEVPIVEYFPLFPDSLAGTKVVPPLTGKLESEEERYIVYISHIDAVVKSEMFIGLFTQWYRRDKYLQMAAYGWSNALAQGLTICLKWGSTLRGSCSPSPQAHVFLRHPDPHKKQILHLTKVLTVGRRAELFGFQEKFVVKLSELQHLGLLRDGIMALDVSFKA